MSTTNNLNRIFVSPYLRVTRNIPTELQPLVIELNRIYPDIANAVNQRTIGIFPNASPIATGEQWYLNANAHSVNSEKQQTLRKVFILPPLSGNHNITNFTSVAFTRIYGTAYDGNIWYPLPYVDVTNITNQIQVVLNSTTYDVIRGTTSPAINKGFLILEWLANP